LSKQLNRFRGTMSVYQNNISKNKIDLKQVQYKDIDKRYFDQLIQLKVGHFANCLDVFFVKSVVNLEILLQTTEMANKDLDRYYNALDK